MDYTEDLFVNFIQGIKYLKYIFYDSLNNFRLTIKLCELLPELIKHDLISQKYWAQNSDQKHLINYFCIPFECFLINMIKSLLTIIHCPNFFVFQKYHSISISIKFKKLC